MTNSDTPKQYLRDLYFADMARQVAKRSKCSSRQVGAVIVVDGSIVSEGYNGSPRGSSMCQDPTQKCRRQQKGFRSGEGLEHCPAVHAEANAIAQAARNGIQVRGATLYVWPCLPCKWCVGLMVNAGIARLVHVHEEPYDEMADLLLDESEIVRHVVFREDVDAL